MDNTDIAALMNGPLRPERDRTFKEAINSKDFKRRYGRNLAFIIACWRQHKRWADENGIDLSQISRANNPDSPLQG